jgi:hypothetical protein
MGSQIIDNDGHLVDYDAIENSEQFQEQDLDFRATWLDYFQDKYPSMQDSATDMAVVLVKMLDDIVPKYTECHNQECTEYFTWMGVASYAILINKYNDKALEVFGKACAKEWVAGQIIKVEDRVKALLHYTFKDVKEDLKKGATNGSINSGKTTVSADPIH